MSKDDLAVLTRVIEAWPNDAAVAGEISDACQRAIDACTGLGNGQTGWKDIASLTRQVLLTTKYTWQGTPAILVPSAPPWPTRGQWHRVGCSAESVGGSHFRIRAELWTPPVGDHESGEATRLQVEATYREMVVGEAPRVEADPFWFQAHGYDTYRGEAQRQAARAAVLAEPGRSLIVSLPTGRGKTAVAWSKALLANSGSTVIVVPTVVLVMDMERRTRDRATELSQRLSPVDRFAYVGDLDDSTKRALRSALRNGTQRILYTSPEALVTGLAGPLLDAARAGHLRQIVVDEAHLVDQWGNEFRPEFQSLAGLVRTAVDVAPVGTGPSIVLMSATLAQRHVDILTGLFPASRGEVDVVWGTQLRAAPAYFVAAASDVFGQEAMVLDAIAHLPRPLILYVTRPLDAMDWAHRLRANGVLRVATVTGDSASQERLRVVEAWRGSRAESGQRIRTSVDIVVGTSAFGLGVDMPNVRSVVHACLPETIDRFYQEVGRAGRDGKPTISLLVTAPPDYRQAESINSTVVIGDEVGWKRWRAMRDASANLGDQRYRVSRDTLPAHLPQGFGTSAQWNVRTLTLMAQAGILHLLHAEPPKDDNLPTYVAGMLDYQLLDGSKLQRDKWTAALQLARQSVHRAQGASLDAMKSVAEGSACVGRLLAKHYELRHAGGILPTQPSCRGCPACRRDPARATSVSTLEPAPLLPDHPSGDDPLRDWRGGSPSIYIFLTSADDPTDVLTSLARRGLNVFCGFDPETVRRVQKAVLPIPILSDDPKQPFSLLLTTQRPMLVDLSAQRVAPDLWERPATYVLGPESARDSGRPEWRIRDTMQSVSLATLRRSL